MTIKDLAKSVAGKLRLDSHHTIERFGVIFTAICTSFAVILVSTLASSVVNGQEKLEGTALYTQSFTTSRTQLSGEVTGVYVSPNRTRSMVMMKFKDSSAGAFSANASKYQAFLTGSDGDLNTEQIKTTIDGTIVMFGSSGYMGIVLDSDEPIQRQILSLTVRANAELVYNGENDGRLREDLQDDGSFVKYDQWRVYVNPGASQAIVAPSLEGRKINVKDIYADLVIQPEESKLRATMEQQLGQMQVDQRRIAEFVSEMGRTNVDGVRIVPPEVPVQVRDDEVTGEPATADHKSTLALKSKWTDPAGYDFDWRRGSVREGYLDQIVPKGESFVKFLAEKAEASDSAESEFQVNEMVWKLTDGTDLKEDYDSSNTTMKPLTDVMNNLSQAYTDYFRNKQDYQVESYGDLLELEVSLRNVESAHSVNDEDTALLAY